MRIQPLPILFISIASAYYQHLAWHPTPVFLPGKSDGQRSLVGYSPQGCKESDMTKMTYHACIMGPYKLSGLL